MKRNPGGEQTPVGEIMDCILEISAPVRCKLKSILQMGFVHEKRAHRAVRLKCTGTEASRHAQFLGE